MVDVPRPEETPLDEGEGLEDLEEGTALCTALAAGDEVADEVGGHRARGREREQSRPPTRARRLALFKLAPGGQPPRRTGDRTGTPSLSVPSFSHAPPSGPASRRADQPMRSPSPISDGRLPHRVPHLLFSPARAPCGAPVISFPIDPRLSATCKSQACPQPKFKPLFFCHYALLRPSSISVSIAILLAAVKSSVQILAARITDLFRNTGAPTPGQQTFKSANHSSACATTPLVLALGIRLPAPRSHPLLAPMSDALVCTSDQRAR